MRSGIADHLANSDHLEEGQAVRNTIIFIERYTMPAGSLSVSLSPHVCMYVCMYAIYVGCFRWSREMEKELGAVRRLSRTFVFRVPPQEQISRRWELRKERKERRAERNRKPFDLILKRGSAQSEWGACFLPEDGAWGECSGGGGVSIRRRVTVG